VYHAKLVDEVRRRIADGESQRDVARALGLSASSVSRSIVAERPWPLIRGLIHSDGCRATNRVVTRGKPYAYPRYFFANSISVGRRDSVRLMDDHVGPKT
jgi:hypothetical protein